MKLKLKISLGLALLFFMLLLVSGLSIYYLNLISAHMQNVLKDNYDTLQYIQRMDKALDELQGRDFDSLNDRSNIDTFEVYLILQERNITELGEREQTDSLRVVFEQIRNNRVDKASFQSSLYKHVASANNHLNNIFDLNSRAIFHKNARAEETAYQAVALTSILASIFVLLAFSFLFSFPAYIAEPISELTASIQRIAGKNYKERVYFRQGDEFGELSSAFNAMAEKLEAYEETNVAALLLEKKRLETLIDQISEPILGIDARGIIIFVNTIGCKVLGLANTELIGESVLKMSKKNDLIKMLLERPTETKPLAIYVNGRERYFEHIAFSITVDGNLQGKVIMLKNVTDFYDRDHARVNAYVAMSHALEQRLNSIWHKLSDLEEREDALPKESMLTMIRSIRNDCKELLEILQHRFL